VFEGVAGRCLDEADEVTRKQRRLTDEQKERAEAALPLVPAAVRAFIAKHLCYERLIRHCDMISVAEMAVVDASFCYDPSKSQPTTYYGTAIRHALLKEVRRVKRSREAANERIDMGKALGIAFSTDQKQQALACLREMTPDDRALIEAHVIEGRSLMSLGRERDRDWRTIKGRLLAALDRLRLCVADHKGSTEDSPESEP